MFFVMPSLVFASTPDIEKLVPNIYQYKEFKENKDVLHDNHQKKKVNLLSDELKSLTFEKNPYPNHDKLKANLFAGDFRGNNTIQLKSQKLNLFKEKNNVIEDYSFKTEQSDGFTLSLEQLFLGIIITLCLVLCFIILPKLLAKKSVS